ncbi:hypothetical protein E2C01_101914 [Portunus trituberculatus]|uniref:Uncharacterized protein n=1 Tax=Portunus trituberculatus TaxID=210409 RepID=A0A5B7KH06_PORTR|nr:hypothetical protein [Portunus trituberculatus]
MGGKQGKKGCGMMGIKEGRTKSHEKIGKSRRGNGDDGNQTNEGRSWIKEEEEEEEEEEEGEDR